MCGPGVPVQGKYTHWQPQTHGCLPQPARGQARGWAPGAARPEDRRGCAAVSTENSKRRWADTRHAQLRVRQAGPTGGGSGAHGEGRGSQCSCPTAPKDDAPARLPEEGDDGAASQRHSVSRSSRPFCRQQAPLSEKRHLWVFLRPSLTRSQSDKFSATPSQLPQSRRHRLGQRAVAHQAQHTRRRTGTHYAQLVQQGDRQPF